jgi:hypothetical protein
MLTLPLLEYALMIGLVAYVYCCLLVLPGQILYPWYVWLWKRAEKSGDPHDVWWWKILVGCERCFAGQVALWSYAAVCVRQSYYSAGAFAAHVVFVCAAIFFAHLIKTLMEKL